MSIASSIVGTRFEMSFNRPSIPPSNVAFKPRSTGLQPPSTTNPPIPPCARTRARSGRFAVASRPHRFGFGAADQSSLG